ncbi:MAG: response regulator transcription factor [Lysobacterales bacterium]
MQTDIVVGIVEDDAIQAELLSLTLRAAGMRPEIFDSAQAFLRRSGESHIDVLLLDWNMPHLSGIDLLRKLRGSRRDSLPVILVTAMGDERDLVYGFSCGADDYIIKPPSAPELIARVRAVYRRSSNGIAGIEANTAPYRFDLRARELRIDGELVATTEREFDLLAYFFKRPDRIVSRKMLLTDIWNLPETSTTRSVDTFVSRLRTSFGLNGRRGWRLDGVYQHGYRLVRLDSEDAPGEADSSGQAKPGAAQGRDLAHSS